MADINQLLEMMVKLGASDLHITAGSPPCYRINGELRPVDCPKLLPNDVVDMMQSLTPPNKRQVFDEVGTADFSYSIPQVARYRVNIFHQRGSVALVARMVSNVIPTLEELKLPPALKDIANMHRGLILVTGVTGSGKSSTISAMISHINETRRCHIVTIEDPIEALHNHKKAIVNQIELGVDVKDVQTALKHVLRQDPDVILFGELRDREGMKIALTATETGHMVFATLHTAGARHTMNRILNLFDTEEEELILHELSNHMGAIISQRLVRTVDKKGRVAAVEIMVNTPIVAKLIKENRINELDQAMRNRDSGMQTFSSHLAEYVREEVITMEEGLKYIEDAAHFRRLVSGRVSEGDMSGIIG